jgi:hypothetical protein
MATCACYITTCLHAEKVAQSLEHATITLNLRQGQANSLDLADFATEVVHDPTDFTFLGGAYTMNCTPSECHLSLNTTHGVGIRGKTPYTCKLSPSVPPPLSALKPKCGTTYSYKPPSNSFRVAPRNPVVHQGRIAQSKKDKAHNEHIKALAFLDNHSSTLQIL